MTIAKDFASKLAVAFVAAAMIFTAFASTAKAQTTEDLQQMINDLLAQVAALQAQTGQGATGAASGVCPYTWTRDLSSGSTGGDVMKLQQFLNADADTRVAATGAGSVGAETEYYGPATAAAVSKFQVKYRSETLSPSNLVNPTGYFGPSSRGKANSLCVASSEMDDSDDSDDSMDDDDSKDDDDDFELGGEADLDKMSVDSASDDELEEGAEDAEVAEFTIEFTNGDAEISRIDISASSSAGNDETDPWDVFESFSLWVDGDKVAEENADDEDDYLDEDDGTIRFSGLDIIGMEDEEVEIVLAATIKGNLDGISNGEGWEFAMEAIRFFDADGVASTESAPTLELGDAVTVTIEEEGSEDELLVKTSSNDPDASTLKVEDNKKSDWYTVFVFDLDTDDSVNDIELNSIKVNASTTKVAYNTLVDDAELVIDGVTIDDVSIANGTSLVTPAVLTFDVDGDVVIDAGDRVEVELRLRFKSLAGVNEGATVKGSISSLTTSIVDAEGADDLAGGQLSGAATGDAHTLRTTGISTEMTDDSAVVTVNDGNNNDYATYEIEVEVTAFDQDVFIDTDDTDSMQWDLVTSAGASLGEPTASTSVVLSSSAEEEGTYFKINEGETETITLTVTYSPGNAASISGRLLLTSITFDDDGASEDQIQTTLPASDYRTDVVTIVN